MMYMIVLNVVEKNEELEKAMCSFSGNKDSLNICIWMSFVRTRFW